MYFRAPGGQYAARAQCFTHPFVLYSGASGGAGGGNESLIKGTMVDLLERLPDNFEMITMQLRAKPLLEGEAGPFVVVALQVSSMQDKSQL